jgi:hypothetical protein
MKSDSGRGSVTTLPVRFALGKICGSATNFRSMRSKFSYPEEIITAISKEPSVMIAHVR